jgi:methionyl-tRNA formyltransferase
MRLAFLGTPTAAVASLEALVAAEHEVAIVITPPDRRRGRGAQVSASPVKAAALERGLRVADSLNALDEVEVERGVVVAYGAIIPASTLARIPMLNVHFSLLPRWRGAAPVERAILAGDVETGVGIISLEPTLDTGPLHAEGRTTIDEKTASELTGELAQMGARLLTDVLASEELLANPWPQVGESTYAAKLTPETFHLTSRMDVAQARRVVRLERAYFKVQGQRLRVLRVGSLGEAVAPGSLTARGNSLYAGFADGALELAWVQPEGSRTMSGADWWAGARFVGPVTWD